MKKEAGIIFMVLTLAISQNLVFAQHGKKLNIAVAEFEGKNVSLIDASAVADFLRTELVRIGQFNVLERSRMSRILAEQKFQMSGCTTQECAVKMGKLLNARYMVILSLIHI